LGPTILLVPGLRDHVPEHWQTHLEKKVANARSVPPLTENKLSLASRIDALDKAVADCPTPPLLVAHSAGVMMVVHWAKLYRRAIHGALLVAPPDLERPMPEGYPTLDSLQSNGWLPIPLKQLPFRSIVCTSTNDPLAAHDRVEGFAARWGSSIVSLGAVGHVNPASGFGEWPGVEELIGLLD